MKKLNKKLIGALVVTASLFLAACDDTNENTNNTGTETQDSGNAVEESQTNNGALSFGSTLEFDGSSGLMEITFGNDVDHWSIDNEWSDNHGTEMISIPVTVTNLSDDTGSMNFMDMRQFGPNGLAQSAISSMERDDEVAECMTWMPSIRSGATWEGELRFTYEGSGEYVLELATLLGSTTEVIFVIE